MPQLTIYLPDDVFEGVRERKAEMNISQICARALKGELGRLEALATGKVAFPLEQIERLRDQKQSSRAYDSVLGRKAAEAWVADADYDSLRYYGERFPTDTIPLPDNELEAAHEQLDDLLGEDVLLDLAAYREGWFAHVREAWRSVKDLL